MINSIKTDLIKKLTSRRRPRTLYHYTSGSGLIGILKSRCIWTTSIRFLNDSSEYSFALKLAQTIIQRRAGTARGKLEIGLYKVLEERLTAEAEGEVYVSSFTENADQLSQWRAYCPPNGGYAVGFTTKFLVMSGSVDLNCFLAPCVYDPAAQEELIDDLIQTVAVSAEKYFHEGMAHDRVFRECFKQFGRLLPLVASSLKDSSFEEEQEWRLVHLPRSFEEQPLQFRQGLSTLIPFHQHFFSNKTSAIPIEEIVIGPTSQPELARHAAQALLLSHGLNSTKLRSSSVPYRTW